METADTRTFITCETPFPPTSAFFYIRKRNSQTKKYFDTHCKKCRQSMNRIFRLACNGVIVGPMQVEQLDLATQLTRPLKVLDARIYRKSGCPLYSSCHNVAALNEWVSFSGTGCEQA